MISHGRSLEAINTLGQQLGHNHQVWICERKTNPPSA